MTDSEQRVENRVPIALRIKLRFRKVDTFVSKFATNISSNGMFISSRKPKEEGTLLRFELRLADNSTVIAGQGKVAWVRPYDPEHPKRPHGMGIEFTSLSPESRELIGQIVERRVEQGLGEDDEIPFAAKGSSAPKAKDSKAKAAKAKAAKAATRKAPRPPASASNGHAASASALPNLGIEEIDSSDVDIHAAVARARALVGSAELDEELEKLYRVSAAPVAETVDEASNNLARMLGGAAVQAKRIRHSDPPTGVEITAAPPAEEAPLAVEAEPEAPNGRHGTYGRAQTDASPDIIDEFEDSESPPTQVAEAPAAPSTEAPLHLHDGKDESLDVDIDIDEATPNPEPVLAVDDQAPNAAGIDLGAAAASANAGQDSDEFSDSTSTTMDLTDLIELPADLEDGDEIDIDMD